MFAEGMCQDIALNAFNIKEKYICIACCCLKKSKHTRRYHAFFGMSSGETQDTSEISVNTSVSAYICNNNGYGSKKIPTKQSQTCLIRLVQSKKTCRISISRLYLTCLSIFEPPAMALSCSFCQPQPSTDSGSQLGPSDASDLGGAIGIDDALRVHLHLVGNSPKTSVVPQKAIYTQTKTYWVKGKNKTCGFLGFFFF